MKHTPESPPKMRELMPDGYLARLMESTGSKSYSNLAQLVRNEHTASKYWPAVEQLAQQTNPTGFAAWKAAQHPAALAA